MFNILDCAGTILGGIVAYHIAAKTKVHQGFGVAGLITGLFLASYPIGANAAWCSWMFTAASKLVRLDEFSRHHDITCAFWFNIAAFLIVLCITQLELVQKWLSARWL